jgi:beta-xylosidase
VLVHRKPSVGRAYPITAPQTSDEFDAAALGLQWQWNANPRAEWASLTARAGFLRLSSVPAPKTRLDGTPAPASIYDAPNFLLQKFPAPDFTATTALQFAPAVEGETAGLVVFGYDYAVLGLRRTATGVRLTLLVNQEANQPGRQEHEVAGIEVNAAAALYLRVTVSRVGADALCRFAYSFDNATFTVIGEPFKASVDRWIGAKFGLIATAPAEAGKTGHADFDWFRVSPPIR